ncbi:class III lanthionine synthetase LanKC [Actinosynnema sp. NPDC059335]|uniref:class III lanthionine synthetase LanKC n=1 Tax=Actinosynnema sp. NPDC059335 TaxID=3346804 RepID=UPI00366F4F10
MPVPMEAQYQVFCVTDPDFYDTIELEITDDKLFTPLREAATPAGWSRSHTSGWVHYQPIGSRIPRQGWKVHVSATVERAEEVAREVFDFCVARSLTFKLVPSAPEYHNRNVKYGERAGGGKLAAIYPLDERHLEAVVTELGELLDGLPGPYVLSDLRWREGPVYVRYGAFERRTVKNADGRPVMAIEDADGNLVPDHRGPVFSVPDWVDVPAFLRPELERRNAARIDGLPFEVVRPLHYSNSGGVYDGREKSTGARVAVKEARPHAGVDRAGRDAVTRLRRERDILTALRGLPGVPELKGYHEAAGHEFLVEEFVEGANLYRACTRRNPLLRPGRPGPDELAEYTAWAMATWQRVADTVRAMHGRGVVFGDLHMNNVVCSDEGDHVWLIDFEGGWFVAEGGRQLMANSGFVAPRDLTGVDVDEHSLAALKIALFAPLTAVIPLHRSKAAHLAEVVADRFGVPAGWLADAVDTLRGNRLEPTLALHQLSADEVDMDEAATSIADGIRASATPERTDRLFPGDVAQFLEPGAALGMANGAAGVLWALRTAGQEYPAEWERWLVDRVADRDDIPPGFYHGLHGIAYALWDLGRRDEALEVLDRAWSAPDPEDADLGQGLAGAGLTWLHFARECGDDRYLGRALRTADAVRERLGRVTDVGEVSGGGHPRAGLLQGSSGPALFLTELFEETGDPRHLDAADIALRQDLRRCAYADDGTLQVNEGFRVMPYLAGGSGGIGIALGRYLAARPDPDLEARAAEIRPATRSSFYLFPGLFDGQAGMVLCNAAHDPDGVRASAEQVTGLNWHVLRWRGHLAFPGSQLLRLSMDLATGSAGVLLALTAARAARTGERVSLPFLLPPKTRARTSSRA